MRKLLTLLLMVFLWTSGMTQVAVTLGARNTQDQQVAQMDKTQLPVSNVNAYDVRQVTKIGTVTADREKDLSVIKNSPIKNTRQEINGTEPITPHPLAPMQGGETIALATLIPSLPYNNTGSTTAYADNYNEVCPYTNTGGRDVVYKYTPATNGLIDITLCGNITNYDTKLYVYDTPTPVTGSAIACNDDYCSNSLTSYISQVTGVPVTGGVTYYIVVDGYSSADYGTYEITVTNGVVYPVPANDECTGATAVAGPFPQTVTGTTLGATIDCPGVLDWNAVWYAITLPYAVNDLTVDWCGTADMGTVGVVYYPTCPVVCGNYVLYTTNTWGICGTVPGATTATTTFLGIPGPTVIYYPAYSIPQMDHVITFNVAPVLCPNPSALNATDRTTTSAKLGWTAGGSESLWNLEVGLPGFTPGAGEYILRGTPTVNSFSATPLSSGTRYDYYVQADCGTNQSSWVGPLGFSTLIECPGGALTELEVCGDSTNNACNNVLPANQTSEPLAIGQTVCGTSYYDGSLRDTDWYTFTLTETTLVTLSAKADFDVAVILVTPCPASVIASSSALSGVTASVSAQLTAGTYYAFVAPQFNSAFACGSANHYYATLTGAPPTIGCGNTNLGLLTPTETSQTFAYAAGDTYYWTFNAVANATYSFSDCGAGEDTYMRIYDNSFTQVAFNDDYGVHCTTETAASLNFVPTVSGLYYVSIAHYSCTNLLNPWNLTYYYTPAPTCLAPTALTATGITTTGASLGWTSSASAWEYQIDVTGFIPAATGIATTNNPTVVTTLTPATTYDFYVRANCSGDYSTWSGPYTFTTACDILPTPFTETVEVGEFSPCWTISGGTYNWGIVSGASGYGVGAQSFRANFYNISDPTPFYLFSPVLDGSTLANPQLEFDYSYATYISEVDQMNVYTSVDGGLNFTLLIEMPGGISGILNTAGVTTSSFVPTLATQWATMTLPIPVGTNMIAFEAISAFGNNLYLDNIKVNEAIATKTLNLTGVLLEGLYAGGGTLNQAKDESGNAVYAPGVADMITVELHNDLNYSIIEYSSAVELSTSGTATVSGITLGGDYFITIRHRNSIETTTATAVSFAGAVISQSFGNPADVYGGNLLLMSDMGYAIFGGDITQDGAVDGGDVTPFDNDQFNFVMGYVDSDVNGDGSVDSGDGTIIDNNQFNFVGTAHP
ncbi:MAG: fibronectin type III [Bacteroidetes bacterium]|nr:MAG: fibronectin type III [Bacteroidota bacterium]